MLKLLAFVLGITVIDFVPALPSREICLLLLVILALLLVFTFRGRALLFAAEQNPVRRWETRRYDRLRSACSIALCFMLGLSWHVHWAHSQLDRALPSSLEQVDFTVTGKISSIPQAYENYEQFEFNIESSENDFFPRTVLLSNYGEPLAEAGARWQLTLRLKRPHGLANPAGFDYEAFLLQRGISARGSVVQSEQNKQVSARWSWGDVRFKLHARLTALVAELPNSGILLALTLGDRAAIPVAEWELFSRSGTTHLLVISGLHIGFAAALGYRLLLLLSTAPFTPWRLLLRFPAVMISALGAIGAAAAYSALAGFSLPTQRALVMVSVLGCATLLRRRVDPLGSLLMALCLCLALNPLAPLSGGLWFSFIAVAALLQLANSAALEPLGERFTEQRERTALAALSVGLIAKLRRWLFVSVRAQCCVFLALFLPLVFWLGEVSLIAPLANFVAIPLVGLVTVPLSLAGLLLVAVWPGLASILLGLASGSLTVLITYLEFIQVLIQRVSSTGFSGTLEIASQGAIPLLFLALFFALILLPKGWPGRSLSALLLLPVFYPRAAEFAETLDIHILDVGQGLAAVVRSEDKYLLYDAGPAFPDGIDTGTEVVVPVLRRLGARALDAMVISHGDNDHAGGVAGVLGEVPVHKLYASETELLDTHEVPIASRCQAGQGWTWGKAKFDFLHPTDFLTSGNNNSCVLRIRYRGFALLLPGDIESGVELALAAEYGAGLEAALLLAPHHGSNTSSTFAFLKNINPYYSISSSGYLNRFGHPDPRVLQRLSTLGIAHLNTAGSGMISFTLDDYGLSPPRRYREYAKRYWYP